MAWALDSVHHLGCYEELRFAASIRLADWKVDLPRNAAEFCEVGDTVWFNAVAVQNAWDVSLQNWRFGNLEGGRFGLEPIPVHHASWQRPLGAIAAREVWHCWCDVELAQALAQVGQEFARIIRTDYRWDANCTGARILFGAVGWRNTYVSLATQLLLAPWAPPAGWATHAPVYYTW